MPSIPLLSAPLWSLCLFVQVIPAQRSPFEAVPKQQEQPAPTGSGFNIESIEFRGARRMPQSILRALIVSRVGGAYDIATLRRDAQALQNTRRFSTILLETEPGRAGAIVRFALAERPLIESLDVQGDSTLTIEGITERFTMRNISLRAETFYDEGELARAALTIEELLREKGRNGITVTPSVEPTGPLLLWPPPTVKITFTVAQKQ